LIWIDLGLPGFAWVCLNLAGALRLSAATKKAHAEECVGFLFAGPLPESPSTLAVLVLAVAGVLLRLLLRLRTRLLGLLRGTRFGARLRRGLRMEFLARRLRLHLRRRPDLLTRRLHRLRMEFLTWRLRLHLRLRPCLLTRRLLGLRLGAKLGCPCRLLLNRLVRDGRILSRMRHTAVL
jgi:hypothetical protein